MTLQVVGVLLVVGLVSTVKLSSSLSFCNRYVVFTEATYNQTVQEDDYVCCITLSEFAELNMKKNIDSDSEVSFQPGIHFIKSNQTSISFPSTRSLRIKGQHKINTTIMCSILNSQTLDFNSESVTMQNMHIRHCTLRFKKIKQLVIVDSMLTDSGILFNTNMKLNPASILIENTDIANYSLTSRQTPPQAILNFRLRYPIIKWTRLNVTLNNLNIKYNNLSLLKVSRFPVYLTVIITLSGINNFISNKNPIISAKGFVNTTKVYLRGEMRLTENIQVGDIIDGIPPIHVYWATVIFEHSNVVFQNNMGGIGAHDTRIVFCDDTTIHFVNNTGLPNGGALSLYSGSSLIFNASMLNVSLNFTGNNAQKGGAIYVQDGADVKSVFNFQGDSTLVHMEFRNNSALFGGNHIYGGWVDWFRDNITENNGFNIIAHSNNSDVASDPVRICLCENNWPNCNIIKHNITVYGNVLSLDLVAVGQRYTPVAAYVKASMVSETSRCNKEHWKHLSPRFARLLPSCTKIQYTLIGVKEEKIVIELRSDLNTNYCVGRNRTESHNVYKNHNLFQQLSIAVKRLNCPLGFHLDEANGECKCNESKTYELTCDLTHTKVNRTETQWIGKTYEHTIPDKSPGIIVYSPCPLDYCRTDNESLSFRLEDEDVICNFNRSGILCGGCETNFSRVLGSSKCKICSNNIPITVIILLGQIIFGPILVISLMMLDITVAVGTINGLIFYANIIQAQYMAFTHNTSMSFLSTFIAWLNLNHGIEKCLFDGLDEYVATWFKLPLPFYIWSLAAALIALSNYSFRFAKLIRKNTVQVLATLFLISHTRSVRIIIDVFSYASLTYPDGYIKRVWLVDGNVEYFKGKHIPLFLITILYVVVTLPYTIVLLSIQFLHKISHYRVMFWVQKLKPFFDAYTGPYKAKHRYWTGLLLLVRIILLIIFIYFQSCDSSVNLLAITVSTFILVGWSSFVGGVYVSSLNNFLESLFLCNLGITSAAVLYDKRNTKVAVFISTSVAFTTFVFIILGHALKQLLRTKHGSMMKERFLDKLSSVKRKEQASTSEAHSMSLSVSLGQFNTSVTSTTVELKEPLLEDDC